MQGNYLSPIIDALKPILIFAAVIWGAEIIVTMLIKDYKKANIGSSYTKDDARVRLTVLQNRRPTWIETGFEAFTSSLKSSLQGRLQSFNRSNLTTQNDLHGRKQESND